ncbi:MAG: MBOAT family protein, partial [Clostridiales bacterium]|nr:MBOAT family protein [Clostridiales bacterium]
MLFNSVIYLIFLPVTALVYFFTPGRIRWIPLLLASCGFYMAWRPEFILLLAFTVLVNYVSALLIHKVLKPKPALIVSLIMNFGLLFFFKYLGFFSDSLSAAFAMLKINIPVPEYSVILPMGISFYTFQAAAYTIDVYRGKLAPERNYFKTMLFITFFPQLVAGPIERAGDLMGQLFSDRKPGIRDVSGGLGYLTLGFFKKTVVADRLADCVNAVYNAPASYTGLPSVIATLYFAFQIYCDFSGYSDIAVGSAKLLGIELTRNFRQPYLSGSIREFWRRWHITLSSWLRDYIYIPLGGSRVSKPRYYLNVTLTFLASGLWHGANWTFVLWGGLHGVFQIIEGLGKPRKKNIFHIGLTFLLVCLAWIFFRAKNISDALFILTHLLSGVRRWNEPLYLYETL